MLGACPELLLADTGLLRRNLYTLLARRGGQGVGDVPKTFTLSSSAAFRDLRLEAQGLSKEVAMERISGPGLAMALALGRPEVVQALAL